MRASKAAVEAAWMRPLGSPPANLLSGSSAPDDAVALTMLEEDLDHEDLLPSGVAAFGDDN